jgi:hypothetical protein
MITQASSRRLEGVQGLQTISALTHRQTVELLERKAGEQCKKVLDVLRNML